MRKRPQTSAQTGSRFLRGARQGLQRRIVPVLSAGAHFVCFCDLDENQIKFYGTLKQKPVKSILLLLCLMHQLSSDTFTLSALSRARITVLLS